MEPVTKQDTPLHQTPAPNAATEDLTGRTLGDYRILRQLGQGGMGQVFLAEQISLKRKVALKLLRPETANDPTALARFQKEAEAVARVTHANIVQVYQIGDFGGLVFMALEYVEGRNLREYLARKGPPDALLTLSIMRQVASALQRAGELGLVHRDIKPENILLTRKGEVKVADFGLVRCLSDETPGLSLTQSGITMGTPLYMSPEQVEGKALDCRSDFYSFGVTCYHMLAGQPPFVGENAFEVAFKHVRSEPVPLEQLRPDLPEGLCGLIKKMMAKDPAARPQSGRELLRDIVKVREGLSGVTAGIPSHGATVELVPASELQALSDDTLAVPAAAPRRRSLWPVLLPSSLLVAVLIGIGVAWSQRERNALPPAYNTPDAVVVEAVTDEKKREQSLDNLVKEIRSNSHNAEFKSSTYDNCLDLGLLYLKEKRWDDAATLFTQLDAQKNERYHWLGHLGQAIALARKDQPKESNKNFKDIVNYLGPLPARPLVAGSRENPREASFSGLWQNGELKAAIFEALEYNKKNNVEDPDIRRFFVARFTPRKG
jgi:serine/threonine protein kinase